MIVEIIISDGESGEVLSVLDVRDDSILVPMVLVDEIREALSMKFEVSENGMVRDLIDQCDEGESR